MALLPGLDQRAGAFFQSYGMNVTEVGSAPEAYGSTVIILYGPSYTHCDGCRRLGISNRQIKFSPDPVLLWISRSGFGSDIAGSIP